ncbi:hypothetical protein BHE74_00058235, partial [Ensete ventricosum]
MPTWPPSHRAPRIARSLTWPNQRDWSKDTSYRAADLAQVRSASPTCRRTPHHKYGRRGGKCGNTCRTADLARVRSATHTCRRTPHHQYS